MQIYDCHTHLMNPDVTSETIIKKLQKANLAGANIFSQPPVQYTHLRYTAEYEERMDALCRITSNERELFPILWIHPDEKDILSKMENAVERGVLGFKMICNNYFVYEDKSLRILEHAAHMGKPILFHSGILWDGAVSSAYNKPINWECCLEITGLKFSMGHCSWPWYDECIALYGKFCNAYTYRSELSAEMFLDITPGTPEIYREDLLMKIFKTGYDVKHNVLFGTDCNAEDYNVEWALAWQKTDNKIYDKLSIQEETRNMIYGENLKRFLGISSNRITRKVILSDGSIVEV